MARARARGDGGAVRIKRAYEERAPGEGHRVLVDRLWPRGVKKEALAPDEWLRELSPSDELRKWFGHDPERWSEFQARYRRELSSGPAREALEHLVEQARRGALTLLYGAKDEAHNNAVVLKDIIDGRLAGVRARAAGAEPTRLRQAAARKLGRGATKAPRPAKTARAAKGARATRKSTAAKPGTRKSAARAARSRSA
jgi:uncharacterized protein YeaO (DUF488 family)